jgi:peptidoglycan hydrolase CwlO-like protein
MTGYPWLKENWWVVLLSPLLLLVAVSVLVHDRFKGVTVVDPLREADDRALMEAQTRARELQAEKERLEKELTDIRSKYQELQDKFEQRLSDEVEDLRNNPEKLRQAMLAAGRGQ